MEVRVRYAPSPTGMQHIGGVRTALFNYLFARTNGGKFILRLEDTDRTRYAPEYEQNLFDTLEWMGIEWDEGPDKGGEYGPYIQSQRFELYKKHALELVKMGRAYYCFCDAERLERIRKIQTMNKMAPGYDRECRHLSEAEVRANLEKGLPHVIRLKVPLEGATLFHDALLGDIEWKNEDINPDPVLLKSDGFPTYHLANIVDDHYMKISHVMRAQEWIPSTPLHVIMYRAFGWEHPEYCHLPMVMGQDGQKLSKRHGATSVNEFRNNGYLPEALVNYIAMLGASYEDGRDIYSLKELESLFRLEKLNKAPAVFDYKKLEWFNGQYMRAMDDESLYRAALPFISKEGILPTEPSEREKAKLMEVMPLIRERLHFLTEAPEMVRFLFIEPAAPNPEDLIPKKLDQEGTKKILTLAAEELLPGLEGKTEEEGDVLVRETAEKLGVKLGDLMMPIRIAVTGSRVSPPLIGSIRILGTKEAIARINRAIAVL
ncbi:MAG: glutamate--tRNA ligase [Spirochaetaceae bacterium]|nr:glutamate--tRNA ligase [Spirochaetaceae bacterium]